jgi:hypothetical protein
MPEEIASNVQKGVVSLAILVIMVIFLFVFFTKVYPWIRGEQLTPKNIEDAKSNFNALVDNIRLCRSRASADCICDGFSAFPAAFPKKTILEINQTGDKAELILKYGDEILKNATIEKIRLGVATKDGSKISSNNEKSIDFSYEPPHYLQADFSSNHWWDSKAVISAYLYKDGDGISFIIGGKNEKAEAIEKLKQCA